MLICLLFIILDYEEVPRSCPNYSGKPLGFPSVFTAFLILLGGVALTIVALSCEVILKMAGKDIDMIHEYNRREDAPEIKDLKGKIKELESILRDRASILNGKHTSTMKHH